MATWIQYLINHRKYDFRKLFADIENQTSGLRQGFYKDNLPGKVRVISHEKMCIITAALPEFSKQEFLITLFSDNLEISAQHNTKSDSNNEDNMDVANKQPQEKIHYKIAAPINRNY